MFENVDGQTTDGRRKDWYTISSPMNLRKVYHLLCLVLVLNVSEYDQEISQSPGKFPTKTLLNET